VVSVTDPYGRILGFLDRSLHSTLFEKVSPISLKTHRFPVTNNSIFCVGNSLYVVRTLRNMEAEHVCEFESIFNDIASGTCSRAVL
jgi:hypothetical protein